METNYLDPFIEALGREALQQIQIRKLQLMLGPVLESNRFYQGKLRDAGVQDVQDIRYLEDLARLPMTSKMELSMDQVANPPKLETTGCPCGRTFRRLEGGVIGRIDDVLIVRGINVFPSAIENIVRRYPEVGEFAVDVRRKGELDELESPRRGHER